MLSEIDTLRDKFKQANAILLSNQIGKGRDSLLEYQCVCGSIALTKKRSVS